MLPAEQMIKNGEKLSTYLYLVLANIMLFIPAVVR